MTETEWNDCEDPQEMIRHLAGGSVSRIYGSDDSHKTSNRKFRLFSCAAARSVWGMSSDSDRYKLIEMAEGVADGLISVSKLEEILQYVSFSTGPHAAIANMCLRSNAASGAYEITREPVDFDGTNSIKQADAVRDIIGTPCKVQSGLFRTVRLNSVPWITRDVTNLAQGAYTNRNGDGTLDAMTLRILADALEEAGCQVDDLLFHLRGELGCKQCGGGGFLYSPRYSINRRPCSKCNGEGLVNPHPPHFRGCWAIDCILGME